MLIFDIETNGYLADLDRIHCMAILEVDISLAELYTLKAEELRQRLAQGRMTEYRPHEVKEGVLRLFDAINRGVAVVGQNIIKFDLPAIEKVFPWFSVLRTQRHLVVDTLVLARLIYADIDDWDFTLYKKGIIPGKLMGTHKLEAWGYRLGVLKGTYGHDTENPWESFSEEMMKYNVQDVEVTTKLYERLAGKNYPEMAIRLEHEIAWLMAQQERNGICFDVDKAHQLEGVLRAKLADLTARLLAFVPPIPDKVFVPKRNNRAKGYVVGVPIQRYKTFNPNSYQQVEWLIRKHWGYSPLNEELYDIPKGFKVAGDNYLQFRLKTDEESIQYLKDDEQAPEDVRKLAEILEPYLMVAKRLGMVIDGPKAQIKFLTSEGKIHGSVNPNGAVTGRASHAFPNLAQVPKVSKNKKGIQRGLEGKYGYECRELFGPPPGWTQVGVDASGLELRCLAHYMYPYDNGAYAHEVVNGDVHTLNQNAAGLEKRDDAKTFIYAFLYGAGDAKIGRIVKGTATDGKRLKGKFLDQTPAIKSLRDAIRDTLVAEEFRGRVVKWARRYLFGLDGRALYIRAIHSALNTLLQSAGALVCKKWAIRTEERLLERGLKHGWDGDFAFMLWIHDEIQVAARTPEIAQIIVEEAEQAMKDTQAFFRFRVALTTEGKVGANWAETH